MPAATERPAEAARAAVPALGHAVRAALASLLVGPGAYPTPLLTPIRATASMAMR